MEGLQDGGGRERGEQRRPGRHRRRPWLLGCVGLVSVFAATTLAFVALAPVYGAPVGVGVGTGPSMDTGGDLLVVYADVGEPAVGDVVVFDAGSHHGFVRHRVVGETAAGYRTAGDRLPYVDQEKPGLAIPHVTDENLLGREVLAVPLRQAVAGAGGLLVGLVALALLAHVGPIRPRVRTLARGVRRAPRHAGLAAGRRPGTRSGDDGRGTDGGHHGRGPDADVHDPPGR